MEKTGVVVTLLTLIFMGSVVSFAQTSQTLRPAPGARDFVQYGEMSAISDGQPGVLLRWQMVFETRNLGFNVYRVTAQGLQLVNGNLIGGYAARTAAPTGYGERYEYYDPSGVLATTYVIQARSAGGGRSNAAPLLPKFTDDFERDAGHPRSYYDALAANTNGELAGERLKLPKDLQATVNEASLPPDINMHRWVVSQPGAKIVVKQDGMYRVTRSELENCGFDTTADSANWRLFMEGNEQAIIVGPDDQYIEFYGRGLDTPESDSRVYYLIVDANTAGKRINTRVVTPFGGGVVSNSYSAAAAYKQRINYNSSIRNGDAENYFGTVVTSDFPSPVSFDLSAIDFATPTTTLNVRLQGLFTGAHNVDVMINGNHVGAVVGSDVENFAAQFTIPTSFLVEGRNVMNLTGSGMQDFTYFDSMQVNYARRYQQQQDRLSFYTPNYRKVDVTGFTSPNVRVFDTTYDSNTQLLVNFPIVNNGGSYTVKLPSDRAGVMYAVEDAALLQSPSVTFNTPSTLANTNNAADVIIISYSTADFLTVADQWANYRRNAAGGAFRVKVADIADVYDEFSYGSQSANAVRDFLSYADANWQSPAPRYVLLIGDASYDPRNYEGTGNWALVPVTMVNTMFQETGSDDAFVPDIDHDGVPDMAIGRVPARSSFEVTTALNKVVGFETPANWDLEHRGAACAFASFVGYDYEGTCRAFMEQMPPGTPVTYVSSSDPQAHDQVIAALNAGPYIANWSGHGTPTTWGQLNFFNINDVPSLFNRDRQSIYTMLGCLQGYFIRPSADSLPEALMRSPNGGGVATWSTSVDTTPDTQILIGQRFYQQIALGQLNRIGDLVVDARSHTRTPGSEPNYSFILLGDPALKVRP